MSDAIQPGIKGEAQTTVTEENVAKHVNKFGTPALVGLVEKASINAVQPYLADTQTSVGFEVHIRHLAPTPIGMKVRAIAELLEVKGNKLTFSVEAYDEEKKIGEGTHRRAIVSRGFGEKG